MMEGAAMRSIDNLREYVLTAPSICSTTRAILAGYIDNIEREVVGMVPLPVDADGEPIHVGDVMEERSGHTFEVASLMVFGGSDNWLVLSDPRNFASFREPHDIRHHHVPTVEDVLREFAKRWDDPAHYAKGELVETFAAKLRLAGDE